MTKLGIVLIIVLICKVSLQEEIMESPAILNTTVEYGVVSSWPDPSIKIIPVGPGSGIAVDTTNGNVVLIHRGNRTFSPYADFDSQNRYKHIHLGPLSINPIVVLHPTTGKIVREWGENIFYLPHGITVAPNGDTFVTDVALHQVLRFSPGSSTPSLTVGEEFIPGSDETHFCKPTSVAVMSSGDFFVSDGYCNSRILKFDSQGKMLLTWDMSYQPNVFEVSQSQYILPVPHALTVAEDKDLLMVAERQNGHVQCFSASAGKFKFAIMSPHFGGKLDSVAYSPVDGGTLFVLNGKSLWPNPPKRQVFVIPLSSTNVTSVFSPNGQGFNISHDIAVSKDGKQIYVIEITIPYRVWKFTDLRSNFAKSNANCMLVSVCFVYTALYSMLK